MLNLPLEMENRLDNLLRSHEALHLYDSMISIKNVSWNQNSTPQPHLQGKSLQIQTKIWILPVRPLFYCNYICEEIEADIWKTMLRDLDA